LVPLPSGILGGPRARAGACAMVPPVWPGRLGRPLLLVLPLLLGCCLEGTVGQAYDCTADSASWETSWSPAMKAWCCQNGGGGCDPWDCGAGLSTTDSWPSAKRAWCCENKGQGCIANLQASDLFDCEDGYDKWEMSWILDKKIWCCKHQAMACDPYDCSETEGVGGMPWTSSKQVWCCSEQGVGCTTAGSSLQFDCEDGLDDWEHVWGADKQAACCQAGAITCASSPGSAPASGPASRLPPSLPPPSPAFVPWSPALPIPVAALGMAVAPSPSPTTSATSTATTVPATYDCLPGDTDWEKLWTGEQKTWCCQRKGFACDPFNCIPGPGFSNQVTDWPVDKITWCCQNRGEGCQVPIRQTLQPSDYGFAGADDLDCLLNLENAKTLWRPAKKVTCCVKENRGCPELLGGSLAEAISPLRLASQLPPRADASEAATFAAGGGGGSSRGGTPPSSSSSSSSSPMLPSMRPARLPTAASHLARLAGTPSAVLLVAAVLMAAGAAAGRKARRLGGRWPRLPLPADEASEGDVARAAPVQALLSGEDSAA